MAQAPADTDEKDLEQKILWVLKDAGTPVKTIQLVKECQVPKKNINQVLYGMKKKFQRDPGKTPLQFHRDLALSSVSGEEILRLLRASGPLRALSIAQALGMKTAKEVNPDLYAMQSRHLLDQNCNTWTIYQPEAQGARSQPTIYQPSPTLMIIQNAETLQIGHGNSIVRAEAPGNSAGPSMQDRLAGPRGSQDIRIDRSMLRGVQLGHDNEMSLHSAPAAGPGNSPPDSCPGSAASAGPEASFKFQMPTPGPQPEGVGDAAQTVHIRSCQLENVAIGNSNRMSGPQASGWRAGTGPKDGRGDPAEPAEGAAPPPAAAEPRARFPQDSGPRDSKVSTLAAQLEATILGSWDPEATEDGP